MQFVSRVANAQEKPQRDPRRHAQIAVAQGRHATVPFLGAVQIEEHRKGRCTVPSLARVAHAAESKAQLTQVRVQLRLSGSAARRVQVFDPAIHHFHFASFTPAHHLRRIGVQRIVWRVVEVRDDGHARALG